MSRTRHFALALLSVAAALSACDREPVVSSVAQPDPPAIPASAAPAPSALHGWLGQWNGVEGTYLQLVAKPDAKYQIIIKDLDGERAFEGVSGTDHIYFERDGKVETIRATDGAGTGMKWLAGKSKWLTIRLGEGFCRE